jgi:hypothetical protein
LGKPLKNLLEGRLVEKQRAVRTIATPIGPISVKLGTLFNFPLYVGEWNKMEAAGGQLSWLRASTVASNVTPQQKKCQHAWVAWEEPQRVPTKLHPSVPARLLFCVGCRLALVFKL